MSKIFYVDKKNPRESVSAYGESRVVKKRKSSERGEEIVRAALRIVARHGAGGLSVARIAAKVGRAPSAMYRHFRGMDDALGAVLDFIETPLRGRVAEIRAGASMRWNGSAGFSTTTSGRSAKTKRFPGSSFPSGSAGANRRIGSRSAPSSKDTWNGWRTSSGTDGQAAGEIREDAAPDAAAMMFFGIVQPAAVFGVSAKAASA